MRHLSINANIRHPSLSWFMLTTTFFLLLYYASKQIEISFKCRRLYRATRKNRKNYSAKSHFRWFMKRGMKFPCNRLSCRCSLLCLHYEIISFFSHPIHFASFVLVAADKIVIFLIHFNHRKIYMSLNVWGFICTNKYIVSHCICILLHESCKPFDILFSEMSLTGCS